MGNAADRTASTELNWKNTTRAYLNRFLGKYRNTGEPKSTFGNGRGLDAEVPTAILYQQHRDEHFRT